MDSDYGILEGISTCMRAIYFLTDESGKLCLASTVIQHAIIEVLDIPEDYTYVEVLAITDTVYKAGILKAPGRSGVAGGPVRITWAALVEKGMAAGVLAEEDA